MEDILKALVSSRQQGNAGGSGDPMANLVGGLLQGAQNVNLSDGLDAGDVAGLLGGLMGASQPKPQASGVSGLMGALDGVMNGQGQNSPVMALLQPYVEQLAKKAKIPPEVAVIVVSFVVQKLLAHHPQSGRDSREFNLEDMLGQINSGKIDPDLLKKSGMVKELSKRTGLDEAAAEKALQSGFVLVGKSAAGLLTK